MSCSNTIIFVVDDLTFNALPAPSLSLIWMSDNAGLHLFCQNSMMQSIHRISGTLRKQPPARSKRLWSSAGEAAHCAKPFFCKNIFVLIMIYARLLHAMTHCLVQPQPLDIVDYYWTGSLTYHTDLCKHCLSQSLKEFHSLFILHITRFTIESFFKVTN